MAKIDLRENEFFERFVGPEHVDSNDVQFWYQLLSCSFNFTRVQDPKVVDKTLNPFIDLLALNNSQSLNLGSLVRVAIDRASRIKSQATSQASSPPSPSSSSTTTNPYYIFQSFNALYLIRSICKNYIENSSEEMLVQSFRARVDPPTQAPRQPVLRSPPPHLQPQKSPPVQANHQVVQQPAVEQNASISVANENQGNASQVAAVADGQPNLGPTEMKAPAEGLVCVAGGETPQVTQATTAYMPSSDQQTTPPMAQVQQATPEITSGTMMLDQFVSILISLIVDTPLNDSTYLLKVEAINSLIVLLSAQMYSNNRANQFFVYKTLMQKRCSIHALILTKTLLHNFIRQNPMPQETGSIIFGLASGLWRVLTLGYGNQEEEDQDTMPLLARQSLLLLNILTNHCTNDKNPYREAIISCQDSRFNPSNLLDAENDTLTTVSMSKSILESNSIKIEFSDLFETICQHLHNNSQVALLLYLLLHSNKIFKPYLLTTAASKLDQLILPLLKILHSSIQKGSHHVYMVLIIFVILSEETSFNKSLYEIQLKGVAWYKDRILNDISLGSFTTLIMIRSFIFNTFRVKDKFLHANLFATLGNLSNHFDRLHPYVCQRLIDLLERLTKRYLTMTTATTGTKSADTTNVVRHNTTLDVLYNDDPLARALATDTQRQDLQDVSSIELDSTYNRSNNLNTSSLQQQQPNGDNSAIGISIPDHNLNGMAGNNNNNNNYDSSAFLPPVDMHGQEFSQAAHGSSGGSQQSPKSDKNSAEHINISMDDTKLDIHWMEEVIGMILKIINNSLAAKLDSNPDLIYTLLYKRNVFTSLLSSHQSFYSLVINVERILTFFYNTIEAYQRQLSVEEIKDIIQSTSRDWNFDQNRDPDSQLLFQYVEDDEPQEFFIPFVWTQVYYSSGISWCPKRIVLFNPEMA